MRGSRLRLSPDTENLRGSIFLLRADLISPQVGPCCKASREGTAQPPRHPWPNRSPDRSAPKPLRLPSARRPTPGQTHGRAASAPTSIFQRPRRICRKRPRICDRSGEGLRTPAAMDQRHCQSSFGFLVSESGSGFTWSLNSHENQLTPWSNDPVIRSAWRSHLHPRRKHRRNLDSHGAADSRRSAPYIARHGQGYSRFQHGSHGILEELAQFVPPNDPIKISRLTLRNDSGRDAPPFRHRLCRMGARQFTQRFRAIPRHRNGFANRSASSPAAPGAANSAGASPLPICGTQTSVTGDRKEFIGRNGTLERPPRSTGGPLSGSVGAGLDPCAALQSSMELRPGGQRRNRFLARPDGKQRKIPRIVRPLSRSELECGLAPRHGQWNDLLTPCKSPHPIPPWTFC